MSTATTLDTALLALGLFPLADPVDKGHAVIRDAAGHKVGDYVIREGNLEHFEVWGRVRDWWKNSEEQATYLDRVHKLIRQFAR